MRTLVSNFLFCLWDSPSQELFIGPPWLERETQICESPVPVPTGTTLVPRNRKGKELVVGPKTVPNQQPCQPKASGLGSRKGERMRGLSITVELEVIVIVREATSWEHWTLSLGRKISKVDKIREASVQWISAQPALCGIIWSRVMCPSSIQATHSPPKPFFWLGLLAARTERSQIHDQQMPGNASVYCY
jgi:hypothetical protein